MNSPSSTYDSLAFPKYRDKDFVSWTSLFLSLLRQRGVSKEYVFEISQPSILIPLLNSFGQLAFLTYIVK